ncbi:interleukin-23 receptor isoform X1 [Xyrauchen texanus]|uniref:interleukin-23 receptor isoform X1 n=1 Tax=Xyrauchen texanus TaxID=154827 RepID=UPI0022429FD7|nr:interleukin-23 receptor isoform X1 [Xyrauchen texanus]XP_051987118.1 interleukin-23 receptor isoform X1 [Xyrauchen texanus]
MDFFCRVLQVVLLLLFNCKFCGCYGIVCAGKLTVDSNIILFGSNLTVHCKSSIERCGRRFAIDFNGQTIFETTSCSTIQTQIAINQTTFSVLCKVKQDDKWHIVCGQDLKAGYPPGKVKFNCVTHRHSEYVNCLLTATNVTYLDTNYIVTFNNKTSQFIKHEMPEDGHVSFPRSVFDETMTYQIHVRGRNALGESNSTFTFSVWDSVLPSTPEIENITFENGSLSPTIHWKSSEDSLKPSLRFRRAHYMQDWGMGNITELHVGTLLMQEAIKPMMSYQFELRVCVTSVNCSTWSHPYNATSPGIAPSHKLDVWRVIKDADSHGLQNVTVFWKPYTSEDYSGNLLEYKLSYKEDGKVHEVMCSAHAIHHTLQLPLGVAKVNVCAVTSAGSSPPAHVSLIYTGKAPIITYLTPAAGVSMYLAWDLPYYSEAVKGVLGFVVQWQQSPVHLQWKRLGKDYNSTFLKGFKAGVLYNISLYIEEANGVSNPAFCQVYAKEESPLTGPDASITTVGEKLFLIQWEQLDQEKQRGFITNYTIYIQRHRDKRLIENKTVPNIFPRSFNWELMGPQESFDVLISAWNSAGEGPKGKAVTCYCQKNLMCGDIAKTYQLLPDRTTDGMIAGFCLAAAVPMVILANLMYLKCVRQRMMKMCMSMGVTWLFEILPKFDNSNAIKLLKDDSYSPWGPLTEDIDPPLTPIEEVSLSWERQDSYPTVLHEDVTETPVVGQIFIDCPYKPQLLNTSLQTGEETTEEEVKEDEEDQFPLLVSPSHVLHDFSLDFTSIPVIHGHLNSFLAMDGKLRSLNVLGDLLSNPLEVSDKEEEETRMETLGDVGQSSFTSQSILPNDLLESCLRGPVFNSIPYSPQGVCHSFPMPEEV